MNKRVVVGDTVNCRLYNKAEGKFYGNPWTGEVVSINQKSAKPYTVTRPGYPNISLLRDEIRGIVAKVDDSDRSGRKVTEGDAK